MRHSISLAACAWVILGAAAFAQEADAQLPPFPPFPDDPARPEIAQLRALHAELTAPDWTPVHRLQAKGGIDKKQRIKGKLFCEKNLSGPAEVVFTPNDSRPGWNLAVLRVREVSCDGTGWAQGIVVWGNGDYGIGDFSVQKGDLYPKLWGLRVSKTESDAPVRIALRGQDHRILGLIADADDGPIAYIALTGSLREAGHLHADRVRASLPGIGSFDANFVGNELSDYIVSWRGISLKLNDASPYSRFVASDGSYQVYGRIGVSYKWPYDPYDFDGPGHGSIARHAVIPTYGPSFGGVKAASKDKGIYIGGYGDPPYVGLPNHMQRIETFVATPLGPPGLYDHIGYLPIGTVNGVSAVSDPTNVRPQPATLLAYADAAAACPQKPQIPVGWLLWGPFCDAQPDTIQAYSPTRRYRLTFRLGEPALLERYEDKSLRKRHGDSQWVTVSRSPSFAQRPSSGDLPPVPAGQGLEATWPAVLSAECPSLGDIDRMEPCLLVGGETRVDASFRAALEQEQLDQRMFRDLVDVEVIRARNNRDALALANAEEARRQAEEQEYAAEERARAAERHQEFTNAMRGVMSDLQQTVRSSVRDLNANAEMIAQAQRDSSDYAMRASQARTQGTEGQSRSAVQSTSMPPAIAVQVQARRDLQQRMQIAAAEAVAARSPGAGSGGAMTPAPETGAAKKTYPAVQEAVAVCVRRDKPDHYRCYSPLATEGTGVDPNQGDGWKTPAEWLGYVGNCPGAGAAQSLNDGGMYWGCGYGVGGNAKDAASAAGVIVSNRKTFYCDSAENFCRRTTPEQ